MKDMKALGLLLMIFAVGAMLAPAAHASTVYTVGAEAPSYLVNPAQNGVGVNAIEAFIVTPGVTFNAGFSNMDVGWLSVNLSSTAAMEYSPTPSLLVTENLDINQSSPFVVDFFAFTGCSSLPGAACSGGTMTDAYQVSYPGGSTAGNWSPFDGDPKVQYGRDLAASVSSVPEPASIGLMGLGLAGIGFVRRKFAPARK